MLGLEAAGLRAQVHDVDARGVVDVDGGLGDAVGRVDEPIPVRVLELARAQALRVDAALGAEHALHELLLAHLEGEKGDGVAVHGGIRRDVEREGGLAHRGARGDEDEV